MMFNGLMIAKVHYSHDKSSLHTDFSVSLPPCVVSLPAVCRKQAKAFPQTYPLFDTNIDTEVPIHLCRIGQKRVIMITAFDFQADLYTHEFATSQSSSKRAGNSRTHYILYISIHS